MDKQILVIITMLCSLANIIIAQETSTSKIRLIEQPNNPILLILEDKNIVLDTILTSYAKIELIAFKVISEESVVFITKIPRVGYIYDHFIKYRNHWIPSVSGIMVAPAFSSYVDTEKYIQWKKQNEGIEYKIQDLDKISCIKDGVEYATIDLAKQAKEERKKETDRKKLIDSQITQNN